MRAAMKIVIGNNTIHSTIDFVTRISPSTRNTNTLQIITFGPILATYTSSKRPSVTGKLVLQVMHAWNYFTTDA